MERDHWIEILRSTGVQTGQSRLHYEREQNARAGDHEVQRHAFQLCCSVDERLLLIRLRTIPGFGGADRDRTDDLKLAKLALSQLSYGPRDNNIDDRRSNGGPGTS